MGFPHTLRAMTGVVTFLLLGCVPTVCSSAGTRLLPFFDNQEFMFLSPDAKRVVVSKLPGRLLDIGEGVFAFGSTNGWGVLSPKGKILTKRNYGAVRACMDGMIGFRLGEKWGFVSARDGEELPDLYESVGGFSQGLAAVQRNGLWGYIDKAGRMRIKPQYERASPFGSKVALARRNGTWFMLDRDGREQTPPMHIEDYYDWHEDRMWVITTRKQGTAIAKPLMCLTGRGRLLPNLVCGHGGWFCGGRAFCTVFAPEPIHEDEVRPWWCVDTEGRIVFEVVGSFVRSFSSGLCAVRDGDVWRYFDLHGKERLRSRNEILPIGDGPWPALSATSDMWGYVTRDGEERLSFVYDYAGPFVNGVALVHRGGKGYCENWWAGGTWAYIRKDGTVVRESHDPNGRYRDYLPPWAPGCEYLHPTGRAWNFKHHMLRYAD